MTFWGKIDLQRKPKRKVVSIQTQTMTLMSKYHPAQLVSKQKPSAVSSDSGLLVSREQHYVPEDAGIDQNSWDSRKRKQVIDQGQLNSPIARQEISAVNSGTSLIRLASAPTFIRSPGYRRLPSILHQVGELEVGNIEGFMSTVDDWCKPFKKTKDSTHPKSSESRAFEEEFFWTSSRYLIMSFLGAVKALHHRALGNYKIQESLKSGFEFMQGKFQAWGNIEPAQWDKEKIGGWFQDYPKNPVPMNLFKYLWGVKYNSNLSLRVVKKLVMQWISINRPSFKIFEELLND